MEFCHDRPSFTPQDAAQLKTDLFTLHYLQIVHRDIKPANILYSTEFKKWVFCDLGLTTSLGEIPGEKSKLTIAGSFNYLSPEITSLMTDNNFNA